MTFFTNQEYIHIVVERLETQSHGLGAEPLGLRPKGYGLFAEIIPTPESPAIKTRAGDFSPFKPNNYKKPNKNKEIWARNATKTQF